MDIPKTLFATMVKNARMDRHWTQEELQKNSACHLLIWEIWNAIRVLQACRCFVKPCDY